MNEADTTLPRPALVWCPFPDENSAMQAADTLLDEELVACANILPGMRSLSRWKGLKDEGREVGVLFKSNERVLEAAIGRIAALHPYQTPAILGWVCDAASPATLEWLSGLNPPPLDTPPRSSMED